MADKKADKKSKEEKVESATKSSVTVDDTTTENVEETTTENIEETLSKAETLKPFSELVTIALRQEWVKRHLVEFVEKTYVGCDVRVETLNARQVCFHIDGTKVPEDGYFSVK